MIVTLVKVVMKSEMLKSGQVVYKPHLDASARTIGL